MVFGPFAKFAAVCLVISCVACAEMPVSGPSSAAIKAGEPLEPDGLPYSVVKLTPEAVSILQQFEPKGLAGAFRDNKPPASLSFGSATR